MFFDEKSISISFYLCYNTGIKKRKVAIMTQLHNRFPNRVYTITDFGARCCDRPQTAEIQAALDRCFLDGGGRVVIPAGIFLTGGLRHIIIKEG